MKKVILLLLLVGHAMFSQIEKQVGSFNKVTAFDKIDVVLIQSDEDKVVINGAGFEDVEIINKNGELKIRMPLLKMLSGDNVTATVYFKNIDAIEANEESRISCQDTLKATSFDIIAKDDSLH